MNNKKIIFGAGWVIGLLAVGVGGYAYFAGDLGSGGSDTWSNGVALVESSWDEAVGMPVTSTEGTRATGAGSGASDSAPAGDSDDDGNGQVADNQPTQVAAPAMPPGPPPVYSVPTATPTSSDETGTANAAGAITDTTAATPTAETAATTTNIQTPTNAVAPEPAPVPVVTYNAPSSSDVIATTPTSPVTTTTPTDASSTQSETDTTTTPVNMPEPTSTPTSTQVVAQPLTPAPIVAASIDHPVIVQVQIAGAASSNDFVKIFNPTGSAIDLTGWKLHKKSSTGTDYSLKTFPSGESIASGAYLTWANSENGFADSIGADVSSTETLSADNSVALMDPSEAVIDAVAWGTGANQYVEGDAYPTDPTAGQILIRKSAGGTVVDTDDNANDFTVQ